MIHKRLLPLALYYAGYFGTYGTLLPFLSPYLSTELGFSGKEIGLLLSFAPIFGMSTPFLWGYIADRFEKRRLLLQLCSLGTLVTLLGFGFSRTFFVCAAVMAAYSFFRAPLIPLADTLTLVETRRLGSDYSGVRMFGSLGFVIGATSYGVWAHYDVSATQTPGLWLSVAVFCAAFLSSLLVSRGGETSGHLVRISDALGLLADRRLQILIGAGMVHWFTLSPYHAFFPVHVRDVGLSPLVTGAAMATGALSEMLLMWRYGRAGGAANARSALMVAFALTVVRWLIIYVSTNPYVLVFAQALHAFSFGLFYLASLAALTKIVPESLRATGQGLFLASLGASSFVGTVASGWVYDELGGQTLFLWGAGVSVLATLFATRVRVEES